MSSAAAWETILPGSRSLVSPPYHISATVVLGFSSGITGTLSGDTLTLEIPDQNGYIATDVFHAASVQDYNNAAALLRQRATAQIAATQSSQATASAIATATAAAAPIVIFQDSLDGTTDTSTKDQWTSDSSCSFGAGGYHISAGFICYAPTDAVSDAITTVSVKQISGPLTYAYGLTFRRPSAGNYYEFEVDSNGKWIFTKTVNGKTTTIDDFTANAAIKKGLSQVNTLSVQAKGSHFIFSVNGTQVGTADDTTFTSGKTGLAGNDGIEVVFTQLVIAHVK